ncbi:MAG: MgtC/SapB family protein [Bacilli bacterium]|nr:MgtC/SapB family protein [Bacilli bacterium]
MLDYTEFFFQIIICFLLSSCIGIERQYRRRSVGLRTIILVSLGSFLFVNFSFAFPESDMTRIAAQVVAGIGFLGAGVILKDGKTVKGLTTAATLWCAAAIGILCSANLLFEAAVGTLIILFTNIILRTVNGKINKLSGNVNYKLYTFTIVCEEKDEIDILKTIRQIVKNKKCSINSILSNEIENDNVKLEVCISDNSPDENLANEIMQKLIGMKDIESISLDKKDKSHLFDQEEM